MFDLVNAHLINGSGSTLKTWERITLWDAYSIQRSTAEEYNPSCKVIIVNCRTFEIEKTYKEQYEDYLVSIVDYKGS